MKGGESERGKEGKVDTGESILLTAAALSRPLYIARNSRSRLMMSLTPRDRVLRDRTRESKRGQIRPPGIIYSAPRCAVPPRGQVRYAPDESIRECEIARAMQHGGITL